MQPMTLCYKMLLLIVMSEMADESGSVPLLRIAERFREFFVGRSLQGKAEENPNRVEPGSHAEQVVCAMDSYFR